MSTGLTITIDETIIVVRGFKAGARLKASGIGKPIYSTPAGGWMLDRKRLPDLEAWLESRRIGYVLHDQQLAQMQESGKCAGGAGDAGDAVRAPLAIDGDAHRGDPPAPRPRAARSPAGGGDAA